MANAPSRFEPLRRAACALAAAAFLFGAPLAVAPQAAQAAHPSSDIQLHNERAGGETRIRIGNRNSSSADSYVIAQPFTTGGQTDELLFLDELTVYTTGGASVNDPGPVSFAIHPADPDNPDNPAPHSIGRFTFGENSQPNAPLRAAGNHRRFPEASACNCIHLLGRTTYFLVLSVPDTVSTTGKFYEMQARTTDEETTTGGLSIGDAHRRGLVPAGGGPIVWQNGRDNDGNFGSSLEFTINGEFDSVFASNLDADVRIANCVSNVGNQGTNTGIRNSWGAQQFTVGGSAGQRFAFHDVAFWIADITGGNRNFQVRLHAGGSINPGASLANLRPRSNDFPRADGTRPNVYEPNSELSVTANTSYFIAFDPEDVAANVDHRYCIWAVTDVAEDGNNTTGWSVADSYRGYSGRAGAWFDSALFARDRTTARTFRMSVRASLINEEPTSTPIADFIVDPGANQSINLATTFRDPENATLRYRAGCTNANATISISGTTARVNGVTAGTASCHIRVWDAIGKTRREDFQVTVNTAPNNAATIAPRTLQAGLQPADTENVGIGTAFRDADGDALTITITNNSQPGLVGATVSGNNTIVITAAGLSLGASDITVRATDGTGEFAEQTFRVTVAAPPAPQLAAPPAQAYNANFPITPLVLPERTPNTGLQPFVYALNPVPAGLAFDAATRTLSGTPTVEMAAVDHTYSVRDSQGRTGSAVFPITVLMPLPCYGADACVGNLNQSSATDGDGGALVGGAVQVMQAFTTPGSAAQRFMLRDVALSLRGFNGTPAALAVAVHAEAGGGGPAASPLATLSGDAMPRPTAEGFFTYTAAAGVYLSGGATYYIAPSSTGGAGNEYIAAVTATGNEDRDSSAGWSLADAYLADGTLVSPARVLKVRVRTTPMPGTGNLGQPAHSSGVGVGVVGANRHRIAQPFTTGPEDFYRLQDVAVALVATTTAMPGDLQVAIHAPDPANPQNPNARPLALGGPTNTIAAPGGATYTPTGEYTFAPDGNLFLSGSSTYFLVVGAEAGAGDFFELQTTEAMDDFGGGVGWMLGDMARVEAGGNPWANFPGALAMRIRSTVADVSGNTTPRVTEILDFELPGEAIPPATATVDLSTVFTDADGDILSYSVTNSAPNAVTTQISLAGVITFTARDEGTAGIRIAADDGRGGVAVAEFVVTVTDPSCPGSGICVSNFGADNGFFTVGRPAPSTSPGATAPVNRRNAQAFTTGGTPEQSFWLRDVTLALGRFVPPLNVESGAPGDISVAIHQSADDGTPADTIVATLTGVNQPRGAAGNYFYSAADETVALRGGTQYFIVASIPEPGADGVFYRLRATGRSEKNEGSTGDWSLGNSYIARADGTFAWSNTAGTFFITRVRAAAGPPNRPPLATGSFPAQVLTAGQSATLDLASGFSDQDRGDVLTFSAGSSATAIAAVNVQGDSLTITARSLGAATVSVTATDGRGGRATATIAVQVNVAAGDCAGTAYCASNLMQTADANTSPIGIAAGSTLSRSWAQNFSVPAGASNFNLRDITVRLERTGGTPGALQVTLHAPSDIATTGPAAPVLAMLTGVAARPQVITAGTRQNFVFNAPPNTTLTQGNTYWVRFSTTGNAGDLYGASFAEDGDEDTGSTWTIGDVAATSLGNSAFVPATFALPMQIRVRAESALRPPLALPAIAPLRVDVLAQVTHNLPRAVNGMAPFTYALTPELPQGLAFDATADPPTISGTPAALVANRPYMYTVRDARGESATSELQLTVDGSCAGEQFCVSTLHLGDINDAVTAQINQGSAQPIQVGGGRTQFYLVRDLVADVSRVSGSGTLRYSVHPVAADGTPNAAETLGVLAAPLSADGRRLVLLRPEAPFALQGGTRYFVRAAVAAGDTLQHYLWMAGSGNETGNASWGIPRSQQLFTADGRWQMFAPGSPNYGNAKMRLRAGATTLPTLAAVQNQNYTVGTSVGTVQLPAAADGNAPFRYTLTPDLPNGLAFNATATPAPTITGTPRVPDTGGTMYEYTATDSVGLPIQARFTITIANLPAALPRQPAPPVLINGSPSDTRINVSWQEPDFPNPPISGYTLEYRVLGTNNWIPQTVADATARSAVISGLAAGGAYEVRVQAVNARGAGAWSAPTQHTTETVGNHRPAFAAPAVAFAIAENSAAGAAVGAAAATDMDADAITYALTGSSAFAVAGAGSISVATGADLDFETTPAYTLTLTASDPRGANSSIPVRINLTNVAELPMQVPTAPMLGEGQPSRSAIAAQWMAPGIPAGAPPISDYEFRHRREDPQTMRPETWMMTASPGFEPRGIITGLHPMTVYEVQVRAVNADGAGGWSASATHRTEDNQIGVGRVVYVDSLGTGNNAFYSVGGAGDLSPTATITTGAAPGGYALRGATLRLFNPTGNPSIQVSVLATGGAQLAELRLAPGQSFPPDAEQTGAVNYRFEHPSYATPVMLQRNTRYALRLDSSGGSISAAGQAGTGASSNDRWTISGSDGGQSGADALQFRMEACVVAVGATGPMVRCTSAPEMMENDRARELEREAAEQRFLQAQRRTELDTAQMEITRAEGVRDAAEVELMQARQQLARDINIRTMTVQGQVQMLRARPLVELTDINGNGLSAADFMLHYIAREMRDLVGDGYAGGQPWWRRILMTPHMGSMPATEEGYMDVLKAANRSDPNFTAPAAGAPASGAPASEAPAEG